MSECKDDSEWEGAACGIGDCVKWSDLLRLRDSYNALWDLLDREENRAPEWKYGRRSKSDEPPTKKEEIMELAGIYGFMSARLNSAGIVDQIYFLYPPSCEMGQRIQKLGTEYSYQEDPVYGPWIVYLRDNCYGCTGFGLQAADINYKRTIICNQQEVNIDPEVMKGQCLWSSLGCDSDNTSTVPSGLCNFNINWRDPGQIEKVKDKAEGLFTNAKCALVTDSCTVQAEFCCGTKATGHYTEEWNQGPECGFPKSGSIRRQLKWVSLVVPLGFVGYVTQIIKSVHLSEIERRVKSALDGQPLRKCYYDKCLYYKDNDKKYRWIFDQAVPTRGGSDPTVGSIIERKDDCKFCDPTQKGATICACQFNDLESLLGEYNTMVCTCGPYSKYEGKVLISVGSTEDCNCCPGKCCCDCMCEDDLTITECKKKTCDKYGPTWMGPYKKDESVDDKKMGDPRPCGCWEWDATNPDPDFPDVTCMLTCGETSACCPKLGDGCGCWEVTKCQCEAVNGRWQGYKNPPVNGNISKSCSDQEVRNVTGCKVSLVQEFGKIRDGAGLYDSKTCDTCNDSSSEGGGSVTVGGKYDADWVCDDRGTVTIGSKTLTWESKGYNCACYGAGGGTEEGLQLEAGASVSGNAESHASAVGWIVKLYCAAPDYTPYDYDASGKKIQ